MEITQFVLEYLKVLLWPSVVVFAILIFKKQLRELLANIGTAVHRLKSFTAPGTTVELIAELSQSTDEVVPSETNAVTAPEDTDNKSLDDLTTGKIVRTWAEIDSTLEELVERHVVTLPEHNYKRVISPAKVIWDLNKLGIIPSDIAANLMEARTIRNQVVHGADTIPLSAFEDYLRTISKLSAYLKSANELL